MSELDFEIDNSSVYSLDDSENERDEICMIIESKENQPRKIPLNLKNLVQPLESQINLYNIWKDLQKVIKEKNSVEKKTNSNS